MGTVVRILRDQRELNETEAEAWPPAKAKNGKPLVSVSKAWTRLVSNPLIGLGFGLVMSGLVNIPACRGAGIRR